MAPRLELQALLETMADNVYFQPPVNVKLVYPCIVYKRDSSLTEHADDVNYHHVLRYQVTVIDRNPDSLIPANVAALPYCNMSRFFTMDNLNHDVFDLYF